MNHTETNMTAVVTKGCIDIECTKKIATITIIVHAEKEAILRLEKEIIQLMNKINE